MNRITLASDLLSDGDSGMRMEAFLALDNALERLERLYHREYKVTTSLIFGGLTQVEVASILGISERTVRKDWRFARAWLKEQL